jgi:hypothetical protein
MPKIAVYKFLTFFIVSFDTIREPYHLHVVKEKGGRTYAAKIWLDSLEFAETGNLTEGEQNIVRKLVEQNKNKLKALFDKAKECKKFKTIDLNKI